MTSPESRRSNRMEAREAPQTHNGVPVAHREIDVSIVMPCLNEEDTVGTCVLDAWNVLSQLGLSGEVIVVDNGSLDRSADKARLAGAKVVHERDRGYGRAFQAGLREADGAVVVLADSDGSHDFGDLGPLLKALEPGTDFVIGRRLHSPIERGAIPWLHRRVGVPLLTKLLNSLYGTTVSDAHCGLRAITAGALGSLTLTTSGMEFASEMIVEASRNGLNLGEVPVRAVPRAGGQPKLRTWHDGFRHLFLLLRRAPLATGSAVQARLAALSGFFLSLSISASGKIASPTEFVAVGVAVSSFAFLVIKFVSLMSRQRVGDEVTRSAAAAVEEIGS